MIILRCLGRGFCSKEALVDDEYRESMSERFIVDGKFRGYNVNDFCFTGLRVMLKAKEKAVEI